MKTTIVWKYDVTFERKVSEEPHVTDESSSKLHKEAGFNSSRLFHEWRITAALVARSHVFEIELERNSNPIRNILQYSGITVKQTAS